MMFIFSSESLIRIFLLAGVVLAAGLILNAAFRDSSASSRIFEDVTFSSGLSYEGMTFGAAWGDFDGDDFPDLYLSNHLNKGSLYRNLRNGQFEDVTSRYFEIEALSGDSHGAAWGDYDNDGDLDLVQLTGAVVGTGSEPKHLFRYENSRFDDVAELAGVANLFGRTRMPLWFDANGDGRLDLFQGADARFDDKSPPFWFLQEKGSFNEEADVAKFITRAVPFCVIAELTNDNVPELVCRVYAKEKACQIFSTATIPFKELEFSCNTAFLDIAAGDFNGDLSIDLYLARKNPGGPVILGNRKVNQIVADLKGENSDATNPIGFNFSTAGNVRFEVSTAHSYKQFSSEQIYIGTQGQHPAGLSFGLSTDMRAINGISPRKNDEESGLYIGQISQGNWQVLLVGGGDALARSSGTKSKYDHLSILVTSTDVIDGLEPVGQAIRSSAAPDRLFLNYAGELKEQGDVKGVNKSISAGVNVVTGDFDNDMDLDLYIVASDEINNHENVLLLNRGDGSFHKITGAGGAPGSRLGVGESVAVADYDKDGFLDILVANGESMGRSLGLPSDDGGYQLYHNVGNENHWIEIDLEGGRSNRDGIGAMVYVIAGGVTQVRMQDGGIHNRGQNHKRLHFGLGEHGHAETIKVYWPTGAVQEVNDVEANRLIRIREP